MTAERKSLPLAGIKVIDFGRYIAGPYCAALLADLGADVIRVEKVGGGEDRTILPLTSSGDGPMYLQMNRNKRAMTLDLSSPAGRAISRRLIEKADVVIANLPPRALARLGMDWDTVSAINPAAILVVATAFGLNGGYSDKVGFDTVGQAMSGAVHLTGTPEQPYRTPVQYVDIGTATACAYGVLAALIDRQKTGLGQLVEGSLLRTGVINTNALLLEEARSGIAREATANLGFTGAPVDIFQTTTGWVVLQVLGQPIFKRWCRMIGRPELESDPRGTDDPTRGANAEFFSQVMRDWCATRTREEVLDACAQARVPVAPVLSPREVIADPNITDAGHLVWGEVADEDALVPLAAPPIAFSAIDAAIRSPAPRLGAHTDSILRDLGYSETQVGLFREQGVV